MSDFKVYEGKGVDLVEPFPQAEIHRIFGWMRSFKNFIESDYTPKGREGFNEYFNAVLPNVKSFGVIDKTNAAVSSVDLPIVGIIVLNNEDQTLSVGLNFAGNLPAARAGLLDEAVNMVLEKAFTVEAINRATALVTSKNRVAKGFLNRLGFNKEGEFRGYIPQYGRPKNVCIFGLLKEDFSGIKET